MLEEKIYALTKLVRKVGSSQIRRIRTQFCVRRITEAPLPENFKMLQIELYDGHMDFRTHLSKYNKMMQMVRELENKDEEEAGLGRRSQLLVPLKLTVVEDPAIA
uniref:Uncharacterized protein n=1 Tax=Cannabis sativa TaxID=3483 RepID=A0A803Q7G3_CANSA